MQEYLYQTADASLSIRQWMQEYLHQTADAEVFPSDTGCSLHSKRQWMQETLY